MNPMEPQIHNQSVALERLSNNGMTDLSIHDQDNPATPLPGERSPDQTLGLWISTLLRYGVWSASITVCWGGILYLMRHGMEPVDYQIFHGEPAAFCHPWGIVQAVLAGQERGIIQFGLLMLIATPVLRVVLSLLVFVKRRDLKYGLITLMVMSSLLYSFLGAYR